ncbi:MAG: hypothetical protein IPG34_10805 [Rhodocyclaceae bacterium]|nr:hypothetical protein [Rhodocyclaceae bacterium]
MVSRANGLVTLTLSATDSLSFAENTAGDYAIERIEFADGSQWQAADVLNALARSRPEVGQAIDGSWPPRRTRPGTSPCPRRVLVTPIWRPAMS